MISVVTVNFKTKMYVEKMLTSLFEFHNSKQIEVFIVDNCSGDDLKDLEIRFPLVQFLYSKNNLGFSGGCNLGIKKSKGDYVVLINPDIVFVDDALFQLEKKMNENSSVGIGGVSLKNLDGTQQSCVWHFPTPIDQFLILLKIPHVFPNLKSIINWRMDDFDYSNDSDVDQVMGAFFCIRRSVLDSIGFLDSGFFMWYEEVDFAKRANDAGWRTRFFSEIKALHKKGSSFKTIQTLDKQKMVRKSLRRYMKKHYGLFIWFVFVVFDPLFVLFAYLASIIRPI